MARIHIFCNLIFEDKVKRESRQYVEKLFKKYDRLGAGAVSKHDMYLIMDQLLGSQHFDRVQLEELMANHVKDSKYTVHNKDTNKFDVKYQKESIDFPSALAIAVIFLLQLEKSKNQFSGTQLVQLRHFTPPKVEKKVDANQKRRIF